MTYLIIGLGNPESSYQWNRHNFGYLALDNIAEKNKLSWHQHKASNSNLAAFKINAAKIIMAKPLTFMNNSGSAVQSLKNFYKIPTKNIIVIYDDLDLPFGKLKVSFNRSGGGHNGLISIIDYLKSKTFTRLRLGIGPQTGKADDFVLKNFSPTERKKLSEILDSAYLALETIILHGHETAAGKYNQA